MRITILTWACAGACLGAWPSGATAGDTPARFEFAAGAAYSLVDDRAEGSRISTQAIPIEGLPFDDSDVAWHASAIWP